ncbi:hypothetical protein [Ralstonia mannitolilytica]|uniref:hypothetical protein n=1 Tax=Ralstonia mannitolilytica TaxID=105219 RepID=UPI0028F63E48|nr:hypothetical protein [Ralstonia mannitolilytica]CAJ0742318.1 hypothetical protein R76696_03921 [Ralstonia mannitolilytica]
MLKAIRHMLFGGRQASMPGTTDALPAECAALIAGLSFHHRDDDPETGAPRIVCMLASGDAGFQYANETASAWLAKRFCLSPEQTKRAIRMLRERFAEYQRIETKAAVGRGKRWADWQPNRSAWYGE